MTPIYSQPSPPPRTGSGTNSRVQILQGREEWQFHHLPLGGRPHFIRHLPQGRHQFKQWTLFGLERDPASSVPVD